MSLTVTNNNYAGVLNPGLSALISIGANDYTLWHSATTSGSKVRMSYVDATTSLQDLSGGICTFADAGDRTLDFMNLDLVQLGSQQSACISELYATDYASASAGYLNQGVDPELVNAWAERLVDGYSKGMENLRWSGDLLSGVPALAFQDGIVLQIQALGAYVAGANDTGYQKVATTVVSAANVIAELQKHIAVLPFEVTSHPGYKLVVAPGVAKFFQQAVMTATGVNNLMLVDTDLATGRITSNFFGFPIYMAKGLGATAANNNNIMSGIFVDAPEGVIKWGVNLPSDEQNIELKETNDGDNLRLRLASAQAVTVIPNGSQISLNI